MDGEIHELFKRFTLFLASGTEAAAGLVIALATVESFVQALRIFFNRRAPEDAREKVRLRLGRWLALALELELAADIVRTAVTPTWNEIGQLAAIVVLRTALNFFLEREIHAEAKHRQAALPQ